MDVSQFSILGESLVAESSEALCSPGSQDSSQPFSPNLSDTEVMDLWAATNYADVDNNTVCCLEKSDIASSISDMVSYSKPSQRSTSRHQSNGSSSHKITTPPNSIVSENCSDEVIVLSQSGTPPYPPPNLAPYNRTPEWLWDWSSRPEPYPPKGWPMDPMDDEPPPPEDKISRNMKLSGLVCSHLLALLLGIYVGKRLKQS